MSELRLTLLTIRTSVRIVRRGAGFGNRISYRCRA